MNLENTEKVLNVCFAYNISILVVGDNGIGKTEMLRAMHKCFKKKTVALNSIDYGGLTTINVPEKIKVAVISDMNVIMSRKKTRESTFGGMAALMTDYGMESVAYNNRAFNRKAPLHFIVACTPLQLYKMIKYGYHDILQRFLVVFLEREESDFKDAGFELPFRPIVPKTQKFKSSGGFEIKNPRARVVLSNLFGGMAQLGFAINFTDVAFGLDLKEQKISIENVRKLFVPVGNSSPNPGNLNLKLEAVK